MVVAHVNKRKNYCSIKQILPPGWQIVVEFTNAIVIMLKQQCLLFLNWFGIVNQSVKFFYHLSFFFGFFVLPDQEYYGHNKNINKENQESGVDICISIKPCSFGCKQVILKQQKSCDNVGIKKFLSQNHSLQFRFHFFKHFFL